MKRLILILVYLSMSLLAQAQRAGEVRCGTIYMNRFYYRAANGTITNIPVTNGNCTWTRAGNETTACDSEAGFDGRLYTYRCPLDNSIPFIFGGLSLLAVLVIRQGKARDTVC